MTDIEGEIKSVEARWSRAMTASDEAALQDLIDDDAILTHGSGKMEEKAPFIANIFRRVEIEAIARDALLIKTVAPTVAVAFCHQELRLRSREPDAPLRILNTAVSKLWVKREQGWRMANYQATRRVD